jgi:hypothetical protein
MQHQHAKQYRVIRTALISGVIMFGLVIWYLSGQRTPEPVEPGLLRVLQLAFGALAIGGLAAVTAVRSAQSKATEFRQKGTLAVVGWALGEGVVLFGGVIYLLTAQPALYLVGFVVFLAALVMVPAPEAA